MMILFYLSGENLMLNCDLRLRFSSDGVPICVEYLLIVLKNIEIIEQFIKLKKPSWGDSLATVLLSESIRASHTIYRGFGVMKDVWLT
jgi:hypothetical protein